MAGKKKKTLKPKIEPIPKSIYTVIAFFMTQIPEFLKKHHNFSEE